MSKNIVKIFFISSRQDHVEIYYVKIFFISRQGHVEKYVKIFFYLF